MERNREFRRRIILEAVGVIAISVPIAAVLVAGVESNPESASVEYLWYFYLPSWLLINGIFGGIHGAPGWSFAPSIYIAVTVQNAVLWGIARLCWGLIKRKVKIHEA